MSPHTVSYRPLWAATPVAAGLIGVRGGWDADETLQDGQAGCRLGPVPGQRVESSGARDRAQRHYHDDDVVGVAENGDEVRHQVDRDQQVDQQQREPDPHAPRERGIGR
jgi:hypothetical protein